MGRVFGWVASAVLWVVGLMLLGSFLWGLLAPSAYCVTSATAIGVGRQSTPPSPVCGDSSAPGATYAPWGWGDLVLTMAICGTGLAEGARRVRSRTVTA